MGLVNFLFNHILEVLLIGTVIYFLPNIRKFIKRWLLKMKDEDEIKQDGTN